MKLPPPFPNIEYIGDRISFVVNYSKGKSVLHIGCADPENIKNDEILKESHLHYLLLTQASEVYGVDLDEKSLQLLKGKYQIPNLFIGNAQELENLPFERTFDLIIAPELIEHIDNPGMFLNGVKRFMHEESNLVITTPNAFALKTWIWGMLKRECVYPEHTLIFHPSGLRFILALNGLVCNKMYSATYDLYTRPSGTLRNLLANKLLNLYFPFMSHQADCLIAIANKGT